MAGCILCTLYHTDQCMYDGYKTTFALAQKLCESKLLAVSQLVSYNTVSPRPEAAWLMFEQALFLSGKKVHWISHSHKPPLFTSHGL